jgi:predicted Zn-dependent protease
MKRSIYTLAPAVVVRLLMAAVLALTSPALMSPLPAHGQSLPNLGDADGEELSPLMERKLGEQIMQSIKRDRDYISDPTVMDFLNNFGGILLAANPEARADTGYDFLFFAVRDPSLNAFALPGGFIGMHSGLVIAAQSESELASVLAHEIGHVSQRHIARMVGSQKQDALLPLAGLLIGLLAARTSPDLAGAAIMGGTGLAKQRQLGFSRDAEREADRVGLQILRGAGFEAGGMVNFFGRLQRAGRNSNDSAPAYLRTHPMTTERIADIEARIRTEPYRQHADSLDFLLIKSRLRVLQDDTPQGWRDSAVFFNQQLRQGTRSATLAAHYGLAVLALRQRDIATAEGLLKAIVTEAEQKPALPVTPIIITLAIELRLAANQPETALKSIQLARSQYPLSRAVAMLYADCLLASGKKEEATLFLRDQTQLYRQDTSIYLALARSYAEQGKLALQHMTLAEYYTLAGSLPTALEQLRIARASADASYYDQAIIDARERELQANWKDMLKQKAR